MNQTGLNLAAISIFAMTLSVLLGPLLNISPFVPAIAVFGVLGVATLDSLQWQGKFGSVALDWFASFSSEHRDRVIHHEAGHFLVAQQLDIPVVGYTLSAWEALKQGQAGQGGVQFDTQELDQQLQHGKLSAQWLDRFCTVWMAGIAAEQITYGNSEGGNDDRTKFRQTLMQLGITASDVAQRERLAVLRAKTLLQDHQSAYEALVTALQERQPIESCYQAINATTGT
ncbi:ATP-dependent Zn protease [Myxacorys almedinensis]|uniref:ATP-dependent Zn protease n=1 Tax=Myxacorys almedinensis A TaxID=2690445 RepID=A0A8J7Z358_9CYAN|nr:ATP-dependent Zn protease [Myxacorys almedinensis]NDJ16976.1 ATP-dependent Zn protease [Myxacorys almedinensis A]